MINWRFWDWKSKPNKKYYKSKLLWFFPKWVRSFTFGRHIFFRNRVEPCWLLKHEEIHVSQYREHGIFGFLWIYFWEDRKLTYKEKRFEKEAYSISSPPITKDGVYQLQREGEVIIPKS